jgi:hypothetical protein
MEPLTEAEVLTCQANWASAIKTITKTYQDKGDFVQASSDAAGELYGSQLFEARKENLSLKASL